MDAPWVVALSTLISGAIVVVGRWLDRRRGVPTEIDTAIDSHVAAITKVMQTRITLLEQSEAACKAELAEQSDKVDDLQRQVTRLLLRIDRLNGSKS